MFRYVNILNFQIFLGVLFNFGSKKKKKINCTIVENVKNIE